MEAAPEIIPFLTRSDEVSRQAAVRALVSLGPRLTPYRDVLERIAGAGDPAQTAGALRVLANLGHLSTMHERRAIRILNTRFNDEPLVVRRRGDAQWMTYEHFRGPAAYENALWTLGSLPLERRVRVGGEVVKFIRRTQNGGDLQGSLGPRYNDALPAAVYALARSGPNHVGEVRAVIRESPEQCPATADAIKAAGLPQTLVEKELLLPLLTDSLFAERCAATLIAEWEPVTNEVHSHLVLPQAVQSDSEFLGWRLRKVDPSVVIRRMTGRGEGIDANGNHLWWSHTVDHLSDLARDTFLVRTERPELKRMLREEPFPFRSTAAAALSSIGALSDRELDQVLSDFIANRNLRDGADQLFGLFLARRRYTPEAIRVARDVVSFDLSRLRDSLSTPALYLAAAGPGSAADAAKLMELTQREFVVADLDDGPSFMPDRYVGRRPPPLWMNRSVGAERLVTDSTHVATLRFLAYMTAPRDMLPWVRWMGRGSAPDQRELKSIDGKSVLPALLKGWDAAADAPGVQVESGLVIAAVARHARWNRADVPLLRSAERRLRRAQLLNEADVLSDRVRQLTASSYWRFAEISGGILLVHVTFWFVLLFLYPYSRIVQTWFFWSPTIRKTMGAGYVGVLLTWNPMLRRKLFSPFIPTLAGEASTADADLLSYKEGCEVITRRGGERLPIEAVLPEIRGHVILEGSSGLGKTMYLRRLVARARRPTVYLPAYRCADGVLQAIQQKLLGIAGDETFLLRLINAGAMDICIDGLNEVAADVRARIRQFMEASPRSNIVVATQPLDWGREQPGARFLEIQPLGKGQIREFLRATGRETVSHWSSQTEAAYDQYLDDLFSSELGDEVRATMLAVLSNPMELTVVASLLARGEKPNLFQLRQQQYDVMAAEYTRVYQGAAFPLRAISEASLAMRLNDNPILPWASVPEAIAIMAQQRFVVRKELPLGAAGGEPRFLFRHEKVADFFIANAFIAQAHERLEQYINDPRFRGVYLTLALTLPLNEAEKLERRLVVEAAQQGEHSLSDPYVRMIELRRRLSAVIGAPM